MSIQKCDATCPTEVGTAVCSLWSGHAGLHDGIAHSLGKQWRVEWGRPPTATSNPVFARFITKDRQ